MIYDIIERYGSNDETIKILCDELCHNLPEDKYESLAKDIYESTQGKHFDEEFAKRQISKMYYEEDGLRHYAPYWGDTTAVYQVNKRRLNDSYNKWDFDVALNMIKSDYYPLLKRWFPEEQDMMNKIIDLTVNWLNDEDNPFGDTKVWCYFR